MIDIQRISVSDREWDRTLREYDDSTIFHQTCWLKYLCDTQGGEIVQAEILKNRTRIGLFCGLLIQKGGFKIFGSPLRGWWTVSMGPVIVTDESVDNEMLSAIEKFVKAFGVEYFEITGLRLDDTLMRQSGFQTEPFPTYWVEISQNEGTMFRNMKSTCCNRIRKGLKNGLIVERADDSAFVDEYYDQLIGVFARQGLAPTRSRENVRSLFTHLIPTDNLFALRVKNQDGVTLATGIFPYGHRFVYYLGGASWLKYRHLCPNDLMHWELMKFAAATGVRMYDMGGSGTFKPKFGGELVVIHRWRKCYSVLARLARGGYKQYKRVWQVVKGRVYQMKMSLGEELIEVDHKEFAFTIVDDTDNSTLENIKPIYDLLRSLGFRTTKTVWVFGPKDDKFTGHSLEDQEYLIYIRELAANGFEIGLHNVGSGIFTREEILEGLEIFRQKIGYYPKLLTQHAWNPDNLYWGIKRFRWPVNWINRLKDRGTYSGEVESSPYFWGDAAKRTIKYIRNYTFTDINLMNRDPWFPYIDRKKPYANYWFSSTNARAVSEFIEMTSKEQVNRLAEEHSICILYTHFASGFVRNGEVDRQVRENLEYLSTKNGYFVPASTLLDRMLEDGPENSPYIESWKLYMLDLRWIVDHSYGILSRRLWRWSNSTLKRVKTVRYNRESF